MNTAKNNQSTRQGKTNINKMNVLITGGSGFIGTNLIEELSKAGANIVNFDTKKPRNVTHSKFWKEGDVLDRNSLEKVARDFSPHYLVHLAARTDLLSTLSSDYAVNRDGVSNIITMTTQAKELKLAIYASSRYIFGTGSCQGGKFDYSPTNEYGRSKVDGERLVRRQDKDCKPWMIVRPTSIWGPWFSHPYSGFFNAVRRGAYLHPRGVRASKSYGFVGNITYQLVKFMELDPKLLHERALFLADYEPLEVYDWANRIRAMEGKSKVPEVPYRMMRLMAKAGDLIESCLNDVVAPLSTRRLNNLIENVQFDMSETKELIGDLPFSMDESVLSTIKWIKEKR